MSRIVAATFGDPMCLPFPSAPGVPAQDTTVPRETDDPANRAETPVLSENGTGDIPSTECRLSHFQDVTLRDQRRRRRRVPRPARAAIAAGPGTTGVEYDAVTPVNRSMPTPLDIVEEIRKVVVGEMFQSP